MDLKFKRFDKDSELRKQRELFIDCFPETIGTAVIEEKHYHWKFHSFPNTTPSYEYVSYIEEDMVGYYAAIPYKYKIENKIISVGMVCDVMTSSKHRGKGIFTKLGNYSVNQFKNEGLPFSTGYPIRKEVIPGHLKVGWKIAFELPLYIKFLKVNGVLKKKKLQIFSGIINIVLNIFNLFLLSLNSYKEADYTVDFYDKIDDIEGIEIFTKAWSNQIPNALIKDKSFLIWRFNAPERNYHFVVIRKQATIVGLVVAREIIKEEIPSLAIIDWMILNNDKIANYLLNRNIHILAKKHHLEAILTMMSKYSAKNLNLLKKGFLRSPYKFYLIIKNLTEEFSDKTLLNEKNWHLMWIDSDDL